ncbi:MAG: prepilin peptidase [bacterium]
MYQYLKEIFPIIFLSVILLIAAIGDLRTRRIPNWLTFSTIIVGIIYHSYRNGSQGFLFSLKGVFLGFAFLMVFYFMGGMGAGDVKLMGGVGGLLGPKGVFTAFLFTALLGGIYSVVLIISQGGFKDIVKRYRMMIKTFILTNRMAYIPPENREKKPVLCYGVVIALGTLLTIMRDTILLYI